MTEQSTTTTLDAAPLLAMRAECDALARRCLSDDKPSRAEVRAMEDRAKEVENVFRDRLLGLVGDIGPVLGAKTVRDLSDHAWHVTAAMTGSLALNAIADSALEDVRGR